MFAKTIAGVAALAIGAFVATGAMADGGIETGHGSEMTAVSVQILTAVSAGPSGGLTLSIGSGNATLMNNTQTNAIGVVQASANTGASAIVQQASSIAAATVLNFND